MRDVVEKASHCVWQIHYHIVFPVKYRRGLLDDAVVKIIMMTAKAIEDRNEICGVVSFGRMAIMLQL